MLDDGAKSQILDNSTELIFVIDSNARYLDFRKLWTLKTTEIVRCGNMQDVFNYWTNNTKTYSNLRYFFMSVGCNDLVFHTPHQLFTDIHKLVERLSTSFPDIKIILSEVTPRMDKIDKRVEEFNVLVSQYVKGESNLFLTKNSNLRNPDFFLADGIHLNHSITPRFASNIKRSLRAAYGIPNPRYDNKSFSSQQSTNSFPKSTSDENRSFSSQRSANSNSYSFSSNSGKHVSPPNGSLIQSLQNELLLRIVRAFQLSGS